MRSHIDTLTIILRDDEDMEWVDDVQQAFENVGPLQFESRKHGKNHYDNGGVFTLYGAVFCEANWGGHTQRNTVQLMLKGQGCSLVPDWTPVVEFLSSLPKAKISRIDVAIDVFDRSITIDQIWQQRSQKELWRFGNHGRPPKFVPIGDMNEAGEYGRTVYIGTRDSDAYGRVYEKGMQLFSNLGTPGMNIRDIEMVLEEGGAPFKIGDYIRIEVEFKAKTTTIPLSALLDTDSLIAGAYPLIAKYLSVETPLRRLRVQNLAMNDIEAILKQVHKQYGPSLHTAYDILGPEKLLEKIIASHSSKRLVEKGAKLSKEKDTPKIKINTGDNDE